MRWDGFPPRGVSSPHLKVWWGMKNLLLPYLKKLCILYFCFTKKLLFNKERLQSIKGEFIFKFRSRNKRFGRASGLKNLYWLMCGLFFPLDKKENGKKPWKSTRKPLVKSFSKLYRKIRKQIYRGWKLLTFGFEEQSLKFRLWWSSFFFVFWHDEEWWETLGNSFWVSFWLDDQLDVNNFSKELKKNSNLRLEWIKSSLKSSSKLFANLWQKRARLQTSKSSVFLDVFKIAL